MGTNRIYPLIAKEGWPFLFAGLFVSAVSTYYQLSVSLPFWIFFYSWFSFLGIRPEIFLREKIL